MGYNALINKDKLNLEMIATANAIRDKTNKNEQISWKDNTGFSDEINSILTVDDLKEFSTNYDGSTFSWLYLDGYTFNDFISSKFNDYGKISNTGMAQVGSLQITNSVVHLKGYTYWVVSADGTTSNLVKPTDKIESKQYKVVIKYN